MGNVIIDHGRWQGRRQRADESNTAMGGNIVRGAGEIKYPYGCGVNNVSSNSYTCLPGLLTQNGFRLNAAAGTSLYGTSGSVHLAYNPNVGSGNRAAVFCTAKNGTKANQTCTGIAHDVTLTYTAGSSYKYALPARSANGAVTETTLRINPTYSAFPAILKGNRIFFLIPCVLGYPVKSGQKFPRASIVYKGSSHLEFFWRTNGTATKEDLIPLTYANRFVCDCEPYGVNVEYSADGIVDAETPDKTIAGIVCTNNLSSVINLVFSAEGVSA